MWAIYSLQKCDLLTLKSFNGSHNIAAAIIEVSVFWFVLIGLWPHVRPVPNALSRSFWSRNRQKSTALKSLHKCVESACSFLVQLKSFHNELLTELEKKVELDARYLNVSLSNMSSCMLKARDQNPAESTVTPFASPTPVKFAWINSTFSLTPFLWFSTRFRPNRCSSVT